MHLLFACMLLLVVDGIGVEVAPLDGDRYPARWLGVSAHGLKLNVEGEDRTVPLDALQRIERAEPLGKTSPSTVVTLRDGSTLPVDGVTLQGDTAELRLRRHGKISLPVRQLARIRFRPPSAAVEAAWQNYVEGQGAEDQLVIRRGTDTLDTAGGVIKAIAEEAVTFELGGSPLEAPRQRLEGVIFGGAAAGPSGTARLQIVDAYGIQLNAVRIDVGPTPETMKVTTQGGIAVPLRLEYLQRLALAGQSFNLATAEPLASRFEPFIGLPEAVAAQQAEAWLGPQTTPRGTLVMPSRSERTYRIEPGFQRLVTEIQIDPQVTLGGHCDVSLRLGDEVRWEQRLRLGQPAVAVDLPLGSASRLTIRVDYGEDGDVGDIVHFRSPRLLK